MNNNRQTYIHPNERISESCTIIDKTYDRMSDNGEFMFNIFIGMELIFLVLINPNIRMDDNLTRYMHLGSCFVVISSAYIDIRIVV